MARKGYILQDETGLTPIDGGGTGASTANSARDALGLGNVDNTSDINKPISTATQAALNLKANGPQYSNSTITTNNTPITVYSFLIPSNSAALLQVSFIARDSGASFSYGGELLNIARRLTSNAILEGTTNGSGTTLNTFSPTRPALTFAVNGSNVNVVITGKSATTISWEIIIYVTNI